MKEAKRDGWDSGTIGTVKKKLERKKIAPEYEPVPEKKKGTEICSNTASHQYDQYAAH